MATTGSQRAGDDGDADVERVLRASRPTPDPAWQQGLERQLLTMAAPRDERAASAGRRRLAETTAWLRRPLVVGGAAAAGLASFVFALGLAGAGPLSTQSDPVVEAEDDCRYVVVRRTERVPKLIVRSGQPAIEYDRRVVRRRVERCD